MTTSRKDIMNELYTAALITIGAVGVSFVSKKLTKDSLGIPSTLNGTVKLAVAIGLSAITVKMLQDKKYLPEEITKE